MSSLRLTYSDVYNEVSRFLGWGSSPSGTTLTNAQAIVHSGYRKFLYPIDMTRGRRHTWSFMVKHDTLITKDDVWQYALPQDFERLHTRFKHDSDSGYPPLTMVSASYILERRAGSESSSYPTAFAIQPARYNAEAEQWYEVWFDQVPNSDYTLHYSYVLRPPQLANSTDYFIGGDLASEAILEASLAVAELRYDDTIGIHAQEANTLIQQLIQNDVVSRPDIYGVLGKGTGVLERYMPAIIDTDTGLYPDENPNL